MAHPSRTERAQRLSESPSATARGYKTAHKRVKRHHPTENTPEHPKTQQRQNLRLSRHNERESNTAKHKAHATTPFKPPITDAKQQSRANTPPKQSKPTQRKYKAFEHIRHISRCYYIAALRNISRFALPFFYFFGYYIFLCFLCFFLSFLYESRAFFALFTNYALKYFDNILTTSNLLEKS